MVSLSKKSTMKTSSVIRKKDESQDGGNKKTKQTKFFEKQTYFTL